MLWLMMLAASLVVTPTSLKPPAIGVFIDFDATPSPRSVDEMKKEAGKLLHSAGYVLDWRALKQNRGNESFANVVGERTLRLKSSACSAAACRRAQAP